MESGHLSKAMGTTKDVKSTRKTSGSKQVEAWTNENDEKRQPSTQPVRPELMASTKMEARDRLEKMNEAKCRTIVAMEASMQ